jgi:hypothetical protein
VVSALLKFVYRLTPTCGAPITAGLVHDGEGDVL